MSGTSAAHTREQYTEAAEPPPTRNRRPLICSSHRAPRSQPATLATSMSIARRHLMGIVRRNCPHARLYDHWGVVQPRSRYFRHQVATNSRTEELSVAAEKWLAGVVLTRLGCVHVTGSFDNMEFFEHPVLSRNVIRPTARTRVHFFLFSSYHLSFDHSHPPAWFRIHFLRLQNLNRHAMALFRELAGAGYRNSFVWSKDLKNLNLVSSYMFTLFWSPSGDFHTTSPWRAVPTLTPCCYLDVCYHFIQACVATLAVCNVRGLGYRWIHRRESIHVFKYRKLGLCCLHIVASISDRTVQV